MAVTYELERRSTSSPSYPMSAIRCMPSSFINNKSNTGHVVTDLEMQHMMCGDFKAGSSSGVHF